MPEIQEMRIIRGFELHAGFLNQGEQASMLEDIRTVVSAAPLFHPETRSGRKMSVAMTSAGRYGWYSDRFGYRYRDRHPSGCSWPPIPKSVLTVWNRLVPDAERSPDCCLVNFYAEGARMGLHRDCDEADFCWPVISISLGDDALFRMGNDHRSGSTESVWLRSGDAVVMGGDARLRHHGIDRIKFGSSNLLLRGGRINLTLRVVD